MEYISVTSETATRCICALQPSSLRKEIKVLANLKTTQKKKINAVQSTYWSQGPGFYSGCVKQAEIQLYLAFCSLPRGTFTDLPSLLSVTPIQLWHRKRNKMRHLPSFEDLDPDWLPSFGYKSLFFWFSSFILFLLSSSYIFSTFIRKERRQMNLSPQKSKTINYYIQNHSKTDTDQTASERASNLLHMLLLTAKCSN